MWLQPVRPCRQSTPLSMNVCVCVFRLHCRHIQSSVCLCCLVLCHCPETNTLSLWLWWYKYKLVEMRKTSTQYWTVKLIFDIMADRTHNIPKGFWYGSFKWGTLKNSDQQDILQLKNRRFSLVDGLCNSHAVSAISQTHRCNVSFLIEDTGRDIYDKLMWASLIYLNSKHIELEKRSTFLWTSTRRVKKKRDRAVPLNCQQSKGWKAGSSYLVSTVQ